MINDLSELFLQNYYITINLLPEFTGKPKKLARPT